MFQWIFSICISFCSIFYALHSFRIRFFSCYLDFFPLRYLIFDDYIVSSYLVRSIQWTFVCVCVRFIDTNERGAQCMQSVCIMCTYWLNLASYLNTKWIVVKSLVTEPICYSIWFMVFLVIFQFCICSLFNGPRFFSDHLLSSCVDCRMKWPRQRNVYMRCESSRKLESTIDICTNGVRTKRRWKTEIKSTGEWKQAWQVRIERNTQTLNKELKIVE